MMHRYLFKHFSLVLSSVFVKWNYVLVYEDDKVLANLFLTSVAAKERNKLK